MRTKIVYALTSSPEDFYTEQAYMSMYSVKLYNPECHIILVTDEQTFYTLVGNRARIKEFIDEFVLIRVPEALTRKAASRYIKTLIRQNIEGDYLYIDSDTIIIASLEELDEFTCDIGAVLDYHENLHERNNIQLTRFLRDTHKDIDIEKYKNYFNGGVFYVRDSLVARKFYETWHAIWMSDFKEYGISIDQAAIFQANIALGNVITELDGSYNCQILTHKASKYLLRSKICHYFVSVDFPFPLNNKELLKKVRIDGLTNEIIHIIKYPREVFLEETRLIGDVEYAFLTQPMAVLGRKIGTLCNWTNKLALAILKLFKLEC